MSSKFCILKRATQLTSSGNVPPALTAESARSQVTCPPARTNEMLLHQVAHLEQSNRAPPLDVCNTPGLEGPPTADVPRYGGAIVRVSSLARGAPTTGAATSGRDERRGIDSVVAPGNNFNVNHVVVDRTTMAARGRGRVSRQSGSGRGSRTSSGNGRPRRQATASKTAQLTTKPDGSLFAHSWRTVRGRKTLIYNGTSFCGSKAHRLWEQIKKHQSSQAGGVSRQEPVVTSRPRAAAKRSLSPVPKDSIVPKQQRQPSTARRKPVGSSLVLSEATHGGRRRRDSDDDHVKSSRGRKRGRSSSSSSSSSSDEASSATSSSSTDDSFFVPDDEVESSAASTLSSMASTSSSSWESYSSESWARNDQGCVRSVVEHGDVQQILGAQSSRTTQVIVISDDEDDTDTPLKVMIKAERSGVVDNEEEDLPIATLFAMREEKEKRTKDNTGTSQEAHALLPSSVSSDLPAAVPSPPAPAESLPPRRSSHAFTIIRSSRHVTPPASVPAADGTLLHPVLLLHHNRGGSLLQQQLCSTAVPDMSHRYEEDLDIPCHVLREVPDLFTSGELCGGYIHQ